MSKSRYRRSRTAATVTAPSLRTGGSRNGRERERARERETETHTHTHTLAHTHTHTHTHTPENRATEDRAALCMLVKSGAESERMEWMASAYSSYVW